MKRLAVSILASLSLVGTVAAATTPPIALFRKDPFTDVANKSHEYFDAVEYFRTNNVLKGYPDGTFKPDRRITRAEFTILMLNPLFLSGERVSDCVAEHTSDTKDYVFFPDVRKSDWFADAVCLANVKQIIRGYPDGTFKPGQTISFVEAAKIVSAVMQLKVREGSVADEKWYTAYVQTLGGLHAIPPSVDRLDQPMTRGEVTEMVYRIRNDVENKSYTSWESLLN